MERMCYTFCYREKKRTSIWCHTSFPSFWKNNTKKEERGEFSFFFVVATSCYQRRQFPNSLTSLQSILPSSQLSSSLRKKNPLQFHIFAFSTLCSAFRVDISSTLLRGSKHVLAINSKACSCNHGMISAWDRMIIILLWKEENSFLRAPHSTQQLLPFRRFALATAEWKG